MATPDDFTMSASRDGDLNLDCPIATCDEPWIDVPYTLTLPDLRAKAAEHLARKHVDVLDGEDVTTPPQLTA